MSSQATLQTLPQSVVAPNAPIAETPITTVVPEVLKEPGKPSELDSTRFAQLAKKEAALVRERELYKKERDAFKAEQAEVEKYRKAWEMVKEIEAQQKTDPIAALKRAGFSETDLMNFLAQTEDTSTPEEKVVKLAKKEIDNFKTEQAQEAERRAKEAADAQQVENDKAIAKFKLDIGSEIKKDLEKFEYCNYYGKQAEELIFETISAVLNDDKEMISIDEAAKLVEDYYEEQDKAMNTLKKRGFKPPVVSEVVEKVVNTPSLFKKPETMRVESKQFVDNKVPTKTLSSKLTNSLSNVSPDSLSPEQNKMRILEKYAALRR